MSATGLDPETFGMRPGPDNKFENVQVFTVPPERQAEFDRLMAQGGIEAVVEALKKEQEAVAHHAMGTGGLLGKGQEGR